MHIVLVCVCNSYMARFIVPPCVRCAASSSRWDKLGSKIHPTIHRWIWFWLCSLCCCALGIHAAFAVCTFVRFPIVQLNLRNNSVKCTELCNFMGIVQLYTENNDCSQFLHFVLPSPIPILAAPSPFHRPSARVALASALSPVLASSVQCGFFHYAYIY